MSGFNYTFIIQEDASSGYKDEKTKKWSGMIGEVINGVSAYDKINKNTEIDLISMLFINLYFLQYCYNA